MSVDYLKSGYSRRQVKQTSQELMRIDRDQKKLETRWAERAGKGGPAFARRATALTPAQDAKLSDAFALFDTAQNRRIHAKFLPMVLRSVGLVPTQSEIDRELTEIGNREIDYPELREVAIKYLSKRAPETELFAAFKQVFDREGTGFVDVNEVREAAENVDRPISDDEMAQLLEWIGVEDISALSNQQRNRPQKMALVRGMDFTHMAQRP
jgi:calmodulin